MIAGFGRYMQIARCLRDEDQRADRQLEFTQLDVELSFCAQDEVLELMESCMRFVWKRVLDIELPPFPRLSFADAVERYGTDKPDLRFGLELARASDLFDGTDFLVFKTVLDGGGEIVALRYPGGAALSRRDFDALIEEAKLFGAKGMLWVALGRDGMKSSAQRFIEQRHADELARRAQAQQGDAMLLFADARETAYAVAGKMRVEIGRRSGLRREDAFAFCCITDFPYLEIDAETGKLMPAHHPFTSPAPGEWDLIDTDPLRMRAQQYDMVLNGYELGSGSIRIHKSELQRRIFEMLGMTPEQVEEQFGFFVRALDYGAPPHGGMALGIDRIAMMACGEENLREVIAFPKNQVARDVMMDAPSPAPEQALRELHIQKIPSAPKD